MIESASVSVKDITSKLEDHSEELKRINDIWLRIKTKFEEDVKKNALTPRRKEIYTLIVEEALGLVGDWSMQMFDTFEQLEQAYAKQYVNSPKLGQKLFLERYEKLHKPYDQVKNRLWKLLFAIKGEDETEN